MIDDFEAILVKLEEIHNQLGSLRFGQVIGNALSEEDAYYLSDDDLLTALETYLEMEFNIRQDARRSNITFPLRQKVAREMLEEFNIPFLRPRRKPNGKFNEFNRPVSMESNKRTRNGFRPCCTQ